MGNVHKSVWKQHEVTSKPPSPLKIEGKTSILEKAGAGDREELYQSIYKHNDCFIDRLCLSYNGVINLMKIYQERCVRTDNDALPHN